jgi:hypothetical protein
MEIFIVGASAFTHEPWSLLADHTVLCQCTLPVPREPEPVGAVLNSINSLEQEGMLEDSEVHALKDLALSARDRRLVHNQS